MSHGINRTSLTPYAESMQDPDPKGARRLAAQQWRIDGTIVLLPDSIKRLDPLDRDLVRAIATKIYGPR
jgi:hypothetical protein